MYYRKVGESRNSYARLVFLNEMVSRQDIDYIDNLIEYEQEPPLKFHQERCHMCLLGLKKQVYSGYYHLTTNEYMEIYVTFEQAAVEYFTRYRLDGEIFLTLYHDKQIAVIFTVSQDSGISVEEVFRYIQDLLQKLYQDRFMKDGIYCNQTFVLREPLTRAQIPDGYTCLQQLAKLSFFLEAPGVIWPELIEEKKREWGREELRQLLRKLFQAVGDCDQAACQELLRDLFLVKIKGSFDFYVLDGCLAQLKQFYVQVCNVYDIPMGEDINRLFDRRSYPKIEQLAGRMEEVFLGCTDPQIRRGRTYSRVVRECIQILKEDFCSPDISLTYVARQLNISAGYLSSAFNREVHSSIARYIINLRMEKAKKLLKTGRLGVGEIAAAVGFENKRYFSESFKKETGMTPKEFRVYHTL